MADSITDDQRSILLVEDDSTTAIFLKRVLEKSGFNICSIASNMDEVKSLIAAQKPHMAIIDIMLNGEMLGFEVAKLLRYSLNIPFLYLTSFSSSDVLEQAAETEPYAYLLKPVSSMELSIAVNMTLKKSKSDSDMQKKLGDYGKLIQRYKYMVECADDIIYLTDKEGIFFYVNPAVERITGYRRHEIIGRHYLDFIHHDHRQRVYDTVAHQLKAKKQSEYMEFPVVCKDGKELWIGQSSSLLMDDEEAIGFQSISRDISTQKNMETAIRENEKKTRSEVNRLREIQTTFLPKTEKIPMYDIGVVYQPARDISGDFIDEFFVNDRTCQLVLGDVTDHGIAAAYVGSHARGVIRSLSSQCPDPAALLKKMNMGLADDFKDLFYFVTCAVMWIDIGNGDLRYSSAGHPNSFLFRKADGSCISIGETGPLLGVIRDAGYSNIDLSMESGDVLLMYTDGAIEAFSGIWEEQYGVERFRNDFIEHARLSAGDIVRSILTRINGFTGSENPVDDISMICLKKR